MLTTSRTSQRYGLILGTVALTLVLWLVCKWHSQDWFLNPYKYPAKAASLTATVLMAWSVLLSTRWKVLENHFGGLDKVYQVHKRVGRWAFFVILLHPFFLALDRLPDLSGFFGFFWFQAPHGDRYLWGANAGVAALLVMSGLIAVTLWGRLPYHVWKKSHEWFGLVLGLAAVHVILVQADVASYPVLGIFFYSLTGTALAGFVYIRFLYPYLGPKHEYVLEAKEQAGEILELIFVPTGRPMDFKPSQFVYLVVHTEGITAEPHPYSIACGYNLEGRFKLGVRQVGDHTRTLSLLEPGNRVSVYGPYGRFSDAFLTAERDCVFIGGGIGITPFLGMWHVALHSEERIPERDAPRNLQRMHPETIRSWKSPRVALFYLCRHGHEAGFDKDIRREVESSHFHGFSAMEQRGHLYELHLSAERGRISAAWINDRIGGDIAERYIFLCGPWPMVSSLIKQLKAVGVPRERIIVEDFNLV